MSNQTENVDTRTNDRLDELLNYVHHVGRFNQKPVFTVNEYKQLNIWEHHVKGKIGIQHNLTDSDGVPIWLRVERLKRIVPPAIPERIQEWTSVGNDPDSYPQIKDKLIKTLPENEAEKLVAEEVVSEEDVRDPLKNENAELKLKDVIFRLKNIPSVKKEIDDYLNEQWLPWSEEEKPRRATIEIYDSLFSLQQTIEAQGDEQPIELIWGIGIFRWLCEGHRLDHPLLEKPIEIEVNRKDGAILVHPRNNDPTLAVGAFFALENPGVDALLRFEKKHFSELSEDVEFSPYIHESFEPVLRQASTHLSEKGVYWPDINPDKENRKPNKVSETLEITDSWVIFARPRSVTGFVQDIERFQEKLEGPALRIPAPTKRLVTELSNEKPLLGGMGTSSGGGFSPTTSPSHKNQKPELFFPKAFNDAQVQIIERLEANDAVVVQGPPGTGKTHTIANIICHYLATGRSVLVTSKGEPALSVLQEQIPEELRSLTISLLSNERRGMKQLESAVQLLAGLVSQTSLRELAQEAEASDLRVKQLEREINGVDGQIKDWGLKQLNPVNISLSGSSAEMTAMELAQQVINDSGDHDWLTDELGSDEKYNPQFNDSDIAKIRAARKALGDDIAYVGKRLLNPQDMPDSAHILAIHDDLATSVRITEDTEKNDIPPLAVSVDNSVNRAKDLLTPLKNIFDLLGQIEKSPWIGRIFYSWVNSESKNDASINLFDALRNELYELSEKRQEFLRTLVEVNNPSACMEEVTEALNNLVNQKRPFGIFSFGNAEAKKIIEQIRVNGDAPTDAKQWKTCLDYVLFQEAARKFVIKWNHAGTELDLPELSYSYGSLLKDVQPIYGSIKNAENIVKDWDHVRKEVAELFPHGIDTTKLSKSRLEIKKVFQAIKLHTSRISLGAQRLQLQDLTEKLKRSDSEISKKIRMFIAKVVGNPSHSSDVVQQSWQGLVDELGRLNQLSSSMRDVEDISQKVSESGAHEWARRLKTEAVLTADDDLTPEDWFRSWQWKRRESYLHEIDGRENLKQLANKRTFLDRDLKKTFSTLVRIKTNIGLHQNMSERVQGALMRFVSSVSKIGKGTGKRAPRHRRDAYRAMQDCYGGVPCWIMPTWRVSESLPSEFGAFDLVIIDEASQSDITALPAIMRATKLLIVGDDKQVSPTAAFLAEEKILQLKHNFLREQPFAELLLPGVSIYDLANAVFPGTRILLTEHFRCVEPIIRFSMQFYNEPLIPLRIPKVSEKLTPPLVDVYVEHGKRDERRKVNEHEARAIITEIKKLVSDPKYVNRSIGVVSLIGAQQAKYIQDQLLIELGEDVYQDYRIACGDAPTFQGKERDIMFLSMVVGKGQGVAMTKREYEQRTNVALSRARDRMYLYRSIKDSDLGNESDLRLKILNHFTNPMPATPKVENAIDLCDSEFEREVYKKLIAKGYNVTPQLKVGSFSIDLVVEGDNDRRLAIELDGDKYHPPEKWMEDWKRQRTIERVGWQFWRCWGSSYTVDPDGCIDDLLDTLGGIGIQPSETAKGNNIYTEYRVYKEDTDSHVSELDQNLDLKLALN